MRRSKQIRAQGRGIQQAGGVFITGIGGECVPHKGFHSSSYACEGWNAGTTDIEDEQSLRGER